MAWSNLILDPSLFHGNADPYAPFIDGIQSKGTDTVGRDVCDVIEISFMKAQRTRYIWLSRQDHLPRRIKEINRLADNHITVVQWSNVTLNPHIAPALLTWSPPGTSKPWHLSPPEAFLLKNGQAAPDFTLRSINGDTISLSDYRGSIVWLYVWQAGSPFCRKQMPHLQSLYESYRDKGIVILGLNVTDNKQIAKFVLKNNSIAFPIILDSSTTAEKIVTEYYGN
jgi:thiol-disulfide isomerase/thioredoxin